MTREEIIRNLKYTMEKHKNDRVDTFETNISAMCKDILDYLEQEPCESRMRYVQETVDAIMNTCTTDSIKDKSFRNAARFVQNAIDGSFPEYEEIPDIEPCADCISRAELLKAVDTWDKFGCDADTKLVPIKDCYVPYIHYDDVVKAIKGMPSIQPKPKTGHWIWQKEDIYRCSECGNDIRVKEVMHEPQYVCCPICETKMQAESEGTTDATDNGY